MGRNDRRRSREPEDLPGSEESFDLIRDFPFRSLSRNRKPGGRVQKWFLKIRRIEGRRNIVPAEKRTAHWPAVGDFFWCVRPKGVFAFAERRRRRRKNGPDAATRERRTMQTIKREVPHL
jgi:hypothetical protein